MVLATKSDKLPYEMDEENKIAYMRGTRVPIDTVFCAFNQGHTPEEIVQQFPTLDLGEVYEIVGMYIKHRKKFDEYLQARREKRGEIRKQNEKKFDQVEIRERILARKQK